MSLRCPYAPTQRPPESDRSCQARSHTHRWTIQFRQLHLPPHTAGHFREAFQWLFPEYPRSNVSTRTVDVWAIGEYPKQLDRVGAMGIDYSTIEQINKEVQQHEYELNSGAISKDGTGFYENLSSKYDCLPRAITADEQAYRKSTIKSYLDFCAKQSPFIKKIAEQRGLIEPEQSIEQE